MSSVPDPVAPTRPPTISSPSQDSDHIGVADLLGRLSDQFTTLLRQEVELAKAEAKQELTTAAKAGAGFAAAGFTGWFALLFVSLAAAWGLAELLAPGIAFLIVGVVHAIVAVVLALRAKKRVDQLEPNLNQTKDSLQATADWAKDKTS